MKRNFRINRPDFLPPHDDPAVRSGRPSSVAREKLNRLSVGVSILMVVAIAVACQPLAVTSPEPAGTSVAADTPIPLPTNTPTPTATPSPTPTPTPTRTPTPAATSPGLEEETASLAGQLFEMTLTEQEVNELAQDVLDTQPNVPVSNVYVRLEEGQVVATGQARLAFFVVNAELTGIVPVKNGRPAPEIIDIKINGRALAGPLRTQLMQMITPYLDRLAQAELAVDVDDIQITPGQFRIVGRYK